MKANRMGTKTGFCIALTTVALAMAGGFQPDLAEASQSAQVSSVDPIPLRIAAASDLTKAFGEIGLKFEKETGVKTEFVFGASGLLEKQLENGAPFDVFASANEAYVDLLIQKKFSSPTSKKLFAQGILGMWSRQESLPPPANLRGLLAPEYHKISIANPAFAPYGKAAKEAMECEKLWASLAPKLVYGENIQQAFQFGKSGNAEIAIVGRSTVYGAGGKFVKLPESDYSPIRQAITPLEGSRRPTEARRFVDFVLGKEGQSILKKYGLALKATPLKPGSKASKRLKPE